ncbi:hypothetical protein [Streptomyces davaonensis]|uniref:hypothetical protein n=1 Tax=Streptomyces davaonensis TaxID=348043 RepID=UPI0012FFAC19|nr:hypothetical protein [Streptomyces davaonensis]
MGRLEFALDELSIVIRGAFMPHTFSPGWLASGQLISEDDLSTSSVEVISSNLTVFICGAFRVQVMPEVLQISTSDLAEIERARDLVIGILRSLPYAPTSKMGLNRSVHFTPGSEEEWHAIGDHLAPKEPWEEQGILNLPGMLNVTLQGVRPDKYGGFVQVQVQPSAKIPSSVYVAINDHFDLTLVDSQPEQRGPQFQALSPESGELTVDKTSVALEILTNEWNSFNQRAHKAIEFVAGLGGGKRS